jgi:tRNA pseudouridine13 synthase
MKLKRVPEDFQVEELTQFVANGGPFVLYQLTKRSIGTPEAIDEVTRSWNIPRHRVSYGGLKDRHAVTRQFVTIKNGPRQSFRHGGVELEPIGQASRPFDAKDIAGNRFAVVMRDMSREAVTKAEEALQQVAADGLPNYFDDQRFGSVGASGEFIGQAWCRGDYERTLWLALADPNEDDRADEQDQKHILRELWGRWPECKAALARSHRRSIVTYLADKPADLPSDFRGAWSRVRVDLRSLYLSAFQSYLWNCLLAAFLRQQCRSEQLVEVELKVNRVPFPLSLSGDQFTTLQATELPLPSARQHLDEGPIASLVTDVLREVGLELRELRVKFPRDSFFSKGWRAAMVPMAGVRHETSEDELYPGRWKLALGFELPRGTYATILVKRLTEC